MFTRLLIESLKLPNINSREDFANILRLSHSLIHIVSRTGEKYKYTKTEIVKSNGGKRHIYIPSFSLKIIQRWILENILYKLKVSDFCFGYIQGLKNPLVKNAEIHKNNLFILRIDLKDFFPSINSKRIFKIFSSVGYNAEVSSLLTNICCCDDILPQGAVTSPYLSNIVCIQLDYRLQRYCAKRDIAYSRYVDDLFFSSNNKDELKKIFGMVKKILNDEGFEINKQKTRLMSPKNRRLVAGVIIANECLKAPKEMKKRVRSMIHRAIVTGDYKEINQIRGYVSYISCIESDYRSRIEKYIQKFYYDPIIVFQEAVDAFNKNKIFPTLRDMEYKELSEFSQKQPFDLFDYQAIIRRYRYMKEHGYMLNESEEELIRKDEKKRENSKLHFSY